MGVQFAALIDANFAVEQLPVLLAVSETLQSQVLGFPMKLTQIWERISLNLGLQATPIMRRFQLLQKFFWEYTLLSYQGNASAALQIDPNRSGAL
jgi:hypothetical protein